MEVAITAIGTANPEYKIPQQKIAEFISTYLNLKPAQNRLLKTIYKSAGIDYRHTVISDYCKNIGEFEFYSNDRDQPFPSTAARMKAYKEHGLKLALKAIENCLTSLDNFDNHDITHLITVSCTGMYAPGIDIELVQHMNLKSSVKRTCINFMGCYGAFNAIKVAHNICLAEPNAKVLVVCIEICSIHFQKEMNTDNMISNAIFSDGAAVALIQAKPPMKKYFSLEAFHCDVLPQTHQQMAWQIGDNGFDIVLSSYVPDMIQSGISEFTHHLLNQSGLNLSNIHFYAIHPGGIKILQGCEKALNLSEEQNKYSYQVLRNYGNMSSATILFVLKAIWDDIQHNNHQQNIFSCAFGPGLTLESMILKTHYIH